MPDPEPTTEEPVVTLAQLEQATDAVLAASADDAAAGRCQRSSDRSKGPPTG